MAKVTKGEVVFTALLTLQIIKNLLKKKILKSAYKKSFSVKCVGLKKELNSNTKKVKVN